MKLENLNSDKFKTLTRPQLGTVKGGERCATRGGSYIAKGIDGLKDGTYTYSEDREEFNSEGTLMRREYCIDGRWHIVRF
ncbi:MULTISPECIES: hypothetical protein [Chryseobacterium]|uniref:hypothetical protein n=1 Tax=Chryseobacterium TaxID=59732 RepID=UPI001294CE66|nr:MULTISPECIES: hypothetical protein [Chryseobacterium]MDR6923540.1 hypothetical protein [Chryseobacterium sp. 2987]